MKQLLTQYPTKVAGVAVHDGDPMELASFNSWLQTLTGVTGFPNGSVDRADATGRGSWSSQVQTNLNKTADCGLAMVTKLNGTNADIKVFIGYNAPLSGRKVTIAVTEDKVPQSPGGQSNYSQQVNVDANWTHSHVLRGFVTNEKGDDVTLTSPDNYTIVEFKNVDLSSMNILDMNNVEIVAFVHTNTTPRDVFNVQKVELNKTQAWD